MAIPESKDVWVCDAGVFASQASAVRSLEAARRRVPRPADLYEEQYQGRIRGQYIPANLAPMNRPWTQAAKKRRTRGW